VLPPFLEKDMRNCWRIAGTMVAALTVSEPVHACIVQAELEPNDVKYADVVVVGRISNYRIVRDQDYRDKGIAYARKKLAEAGLTPAERKYHEDQLTFLGDPEGGLLGDYVRFDVQIDETLVGKAEGVIAVTWDNSTFGEPDSMSAGPFLIALRQPDSKLPPLRGPSATILPNKEPRSLTVLQAPCSSPFIFKSSSKEAQAVREALR
jgi:hypothetical protein